MTQILANPITGCNFVITGWIAIPQTLANSYPNPLNCHSHQKTVSKVAGVDLNLRSPQHTMNSYETNDLALTTL